MSDFKTIIFNCIGVYGGILFAYLLGYVIAAFLWAQPDYQKSLDKFQQEFNVRPDYRVYSWYFVWTCRKWIWKEVKFEIYKFTRK